MDLQISQKSFKNKANFIQNILADIVQHPGSFGHIEPGTLSRKGLNIVKIDIEAKCFVFPYFQVLIDGSNSAAYAVLDVGGENDASPIKPDIAFDSEQKQMFLLTGSKV